MYANARRLRLERSQSDKTFEIDALGRTTSYVHDTLNRLVKITCPDSTTKAYIYDFRNNKLSEADQSGRTTQYQYALAGELKSVTYTLGTADEGPSSMLTIQTV